MSTNDFITEDDFFNHQILLGKTIEEIMVSEDENPTHILVWFSDSSCIELVLNNTADIFYMEEILDD